MANEKYSFKVNITDAECDVNKSMTAGALLRRAQQAAVQQCTSIGIDDAVYAENHCVFLLAKCVLEYYAPIKHDTVLTITTCPGTPQRATFFRYTYFTDENGTLLAAVDSRWVLVDTETKRIMRKYPDVFTDVFTAPAFKTLDLTVNKAEVQPVSTERATYTRCDSNGHLNNTQYADIVCDAMPIEQMSQSRVSRFAINYHREVPMGESFVLSAGKTDAGSIYFTGDTDGVNHFEAEITL